MTTTLARSILAELREANRPVAQSAVLGDRYRDARLSALRSLIADGSVVLSHNRRGDSFVAAVADPEDIRAIIAAANERNAADPHGTAHFAHAGDEDLFASCNCGREFRVSTAGRCNASLHRHQESVR